MNMDIASTRHPKASMLTFGDCTCTFSAILLQLAC